MNVKTWHPEPGCKACAQAEKLFEEHAQIAWYSHALAMAKIRDQSAEIARLKIGHDRYETARMLHPKQWHELWERNLKDHIPFDELIDEITAKAKEPK